MRSVHYVALIAVMAFSCVLTSADAFITSIPSKRAIRKANLKAVLNGSVIKQTRSAAMLAAAALQSTAAAPSTVGTMVAKALGYVIGVGSLAVYLPIVISLLKKKSSDGFSVATWVFNLMGITLAVIYPLKKGFPMSTFVELLLLVVQSTGILGNIVIMKIRMLH